MPTPGTSHRRRRSGGERVFQDHDQRLWSVASWSGAEDALVFVCLSDSRAETRALSVSASTDVGDVSEDELRAWLDAAPPIGVLE
ncbi:MAG TPA: hypothetical protein VFK13_11860 [Gemmatimonadaceae bacterium]|nr:hypothetical protein [Gemmatimonadaceae bacterium]